MPVCMKVTNGHLRSADSRLVGKAILHKVILTLQPLNDAGVPVVALLSDSQK